MTAELAAAAAEIDRRHQDQADAENRAADLIHRLLSQHLGDQLAACDVISAACLGLVLTDGTRIYLTAEAA